MSFWLLGPFVAHSGERRLALSGIKQRVLLAHLVLNRGTAVSADRLVDVLWPDGPPASAKANLQSYVWRLRKVLPNGRIVSDHNGYRVLVADDELDLTRFRRLVDEAGELATTATTEALDKLSEAQTLWRGDPLGDLPEVPAWRADLARLAEARLAAVELRLALWLRLHRYDDAIAELPALLAEHPYRERLWQHLMLALAATGRRAEALSAYATVRRRLVDELGVEPGPVLRAVQAQVLAGGAPEATDQLGCRLPPAAGDFTGRARELDELLPALTRCGPAGSPTLVVLTGPPGTGKSTLALRAAHLVREHFPDGQLYADLGGTGTRPRTPQQALAELVPETTSACYRALLADRRVLVVLDDAAGAAQVLPLLPSGQNCAVLVTGRARLSELPGAHRIELAGFEPRDALSLLRTLIGAERVAREPDEASEILHHCALLPLAVRAVGARLADRPGWPLRMERDRLAEESARPAMLRSGTLRVADSLGTSLSRLSVPAAGLLDLLARLGAQDVPGWVVPALLGPHEAEPALDALVEASLVRAVGVDAAGEPRYRVPDLLRWHAGASSPPPAALPALSRALEGWLALAQRAVTQLPVTFGATVGTPARWPLAEQRARRMVTDGRAWFDRERDALRIVTELAANSGLDELAWRLAASSVPYFDLHGHYADWHDSHARALDAVHAGRNRAGEAALSRGLGQVRLYWDDYASAQRHMTHSAALARELGDERGEAVATAGLGTVHRVRDEPVAALGSYRRSLDALVRVGDQHSVAQIRGAIGVTWGALGDLRRARHWLTSALALSREIADTHREALLMSQLAELHRKDGDPCTALSAVRPAVAALEDLDDECCAAGALLVLARSLLADGQRTETARAAGRAAQVYRRTGNGWGETEALALIEAAG